MNIFAAAAVLCLAAAILLLPRRWAATPIVAAACYLPVEAGIEIGAFNFYALRILLAIAFIRAFFRGEGFPEPMNGLDRSMLVWAAAALAVTPFFSDFSTTLVNRLGMIYVACGTYFMLRIFCPTREDAAGLCRATVVLLIPLAVAMLHERLTGTNVFAYFGGHPTSEIRDGTVRAQGAFAHSILAGSIGAACLPLAAALWRSRRKTAVAGIVACGTMVFASGSSGPIMSTVFAVGALSAWRWRHSMRLVRWAIPLAYIGLDIVMNAPAYYILSYIDLTGSSTSWHRAALIDAAVAHWSEWWLAGTEYTRHWLPYGVPWSRDHIDITNYYLRMGVDGGLPLMLSFIWILVKGFSIVGQTLRQLEATPTPSASPSAFLIWALGASLFTHVATFISVSYFDQSVVFLYLTLAAIGSHAVGGPIDQGMRSGYGPRESARPARAAFHR